MNILNTNVSQHDEAFLEAMQSETFKKIIVAGASGLTLSSKSKLLTREPDALPNLLVMQLVEYRFPLAEGCDEQDDVEDDDLWDLVAISPDDGVELLRLDHEMAYRCSAIGAMALRASSGVVDKHPTAEGLRQSLGQVLAAEWRLNCLLEKRDWRERHPCYHFLRRLETLWWEFVAIIDREVEAFANQHAPAMDVQTRKAMVRLRKALNTIESARLAKPSDATRDALEWIKQLLANWALRVMVEALESEPKGRVWTQKLAQEWFKALAVKHGPTLSSTDIKRIIKEEGGPSWGLLYKTSFFNAYMAARKKAAEGRGGSPPGKRVSLDQAESKIASTRDSDRLDEIEELRREQESDLAEEHRPRHGARGKAR